MQWVAQLTLNQLIEVRILNHQLMKTIYFACILKKKGFYIFWLPNSYTLTIKNSELYPIEDYGVYKKSKKFFNWEITLNKDSFFP